MASDDRVLLLLTRSMMTAHDLAQRLSLSLRTIHRALALLRKEREVYIAAWAQSPTRKYPVPAYRAGKQADAVKPERKTPAEYQRAWRERRQLLSK